MGSVVTRFPPEAASVPAARHWAVAAAGVGGVDAERVALVVSELAANAVRHARSPFDVRVDRTDGIVRVEVSDTSDAPPVARDVPPDAASGRGLRLVAATARAWGSTPAATGKTVWCEVVVTPA